MIISEPTNNNEFQFLSAWRNQAGVEIPPPERLQSDRL